MIHSSPHLPARVLLLSLTLCSPLAASAQPAPEGDDEEEVEFEFEASDSPPSETPPTPPPPTVNAADEAREARLVALEDELARLRARLAQVERTEAVEPEGTPASTAAAAPPRAGVVLAPPGILAETRTPLAVNTRARTVRAPIGLSLSGYMQVQYERTDLSEDQLAPGGAPLNEDRFSIRRGRLRLRAAHEWVAAELEIDGSTTNGPSVSVRRANVALLLRNEEDASAPPHAALTVGLTELPYGVELQLGQDEQLFMERSLGSLALFPGPTDVGAVVSGAYGPTAPRGGRDERHPHRRSGWHAAQRSHARTRRGRPPRGAARRGPRAALRVPLGLQLPLGQRLPPGARRDEQLGPVDRPQ
jgi:hypothetical protein